MPTLPLPHSPSLPLPSLPPAARDFEIHRLHLVEFLSTRRLAEKYNISQTRVRQIIARVADWLTEMLPIKSEQDIEKEKRYAIHLAAAQLQNQIEHLQNFWDATGDPKYFRQQTRAITALARLGAPSHTLDSLAANVAPPNVVPSRREGHEPEPTLQPVNDISTEPAAVSPTPPLPLSPSPSPPASDLRPLTSDFSSAPPPQEDCSPPDPQATGLEPQAFPAAGENTLPSNDLFFSPTAIEETLSGLDIMEKRLLTLIAQTDPEQADRLQHLQESLADLRQSRANFVLQLGPNAPVKLPSHTASSTHFSVPPSLSPSVTSS